jgi:hypothetical protein
MQHIIQALVPPASAPTGIGHHYIDSAHRVAYISVGVTDASDWLRMTVPADLSGITAVSLETTVLPPGQKYRFQNSTLQHYNADQSLWQFLIVQGLADEEAIGVLTSGVSSIQVRARTVQLRSPSSDFVALPDTTDLSGWEYVIVDCDIQYWNADQSVWQFISVTGAEDAEQLQVSNADFDFGGIPTVRFKDGRAQFWNPTQAKYHPITIQGALDAESISIGAGEI